MSRSDSSTLAPYRWARARWSSSRDRQWTGELPPVRRDRRLLHRGRRRPRPDPAQRPARLGRPGGRGARPRAASGDFGYANLAIRGRKLRRDPRRAARAGARARSPTWSPSTPAPTTSCGPRSTSTGWSSGTTPRSAGSPRPAPGWSCSPRSTPAARRSTARCAAGSRSTTSWSAPAPARTARPSSTSGRMREYRDWRYWDADRMHLGPAGHQRMAIEVLDTLGVPHDLAPLPLVDRPALSRAEQRRENLDLGPRDGGALGAPPAHRPIVRRRPRPEASDARPDRLVSPRPSATSRRSVRM